MGHDVHVVTYTGGFKTCKEYGLNSVKFSVLPVSKFSLLTVMKQVINGITLIRETISCGDGRNQNIVIYFRKIMSFEKKKKKGRILDVGCGDGKFLLHFKERGWEAFGVDVSETSYRLARQRLGRNVFNCELKDCHFPDSYFDVVTLNHVLEHMLDPNEQLREVHRILKDDGILLLSLPNINSLQFKISRERWFGLDLPRHLYHYSPQPIGNMLRKNGFNNFKIVYPLLDFPLDLFYSLNVKWLNEKSKLLKIISLPSLLIVSILIKLHPAWRGSMEVTAEKCYLLKNF
ncbi:hypothetical protein HKBW3C_02669 [Candidatus Hakubella thermalkaliphila]|nr:hypothetical protein HKBW3C_02669 [Candidatus Hakubella thermalkaliphila]